MPPRSCRTRCGTCDLIEKASIEHTRPSIARESIDGESVDGDTRENGMRAFDASPGDGIRLYTRKLTN
jgi:hypothetical protein